MKPLAWSLAVLCCLGAAAGASGTDLQIFCPHGAAVRLDGAAMGTCSELEEGRYLRDLPPGRHVVEIQSPHGAARRYEVELDDRIPGRLDAREPGEVRKALEAPAADAPQAPEGLLYIVTVPEQCFVHLGGVRIDKKEEVLRVGKVPVGRHVLRFERNGRMLEVAAEIKEGKVTGVKADFLLGRAGLLPRAEVPPADDKGWGATLSLEQLVRFQQMREQLDDEVRRLEDARAGRKPPV